MSTASTSTALIRTGAGCAAAAFVVVAGYEALNLALGYPETGSGDAIVSAGHAVWMPLAVFALVGLYLRQETSTGRLGTAGFGLAVLGTMLLGSIYVSDVILGSAIEAAAPEVFDEPTTTMIVSVVAGGAAFAVGHLLYAIATLRARSLPRPAAVVYLVGAVIGLAWIVGLPGATVVLHAGMAWLGLAILGESAGVPRHEELQAA